MFFLESAEGLERERKERGERGEERGERGNRKERAGGEEDAAITKGAQLCWGVA